MQTEEQDPKLSGEKSIGDFKVYTPGTLGAAVRNGFDVMVLVNIDGGPDGDDWQSDEYAAIEQYGQCLRSAIPCKVLRGYVGCQAGGKGLDREPSGFRLVEGFHVAEGHPDIPVEINPFDGIGKGSPYYRLLNVQPRHALDIDFLKTLNRGLARCRRERQTEFREATEVIDRQIQAQCADFGAIVCLTHDVVLVSYLVAHGAKIEFGFGRWPHGNWPGYLDGVAVICDRTTGEVRDVGLLPEYEVFPRMRGGTAI